MRRHHPGGGLSSGMRSGIVEGEPGIFPDPIARLLRLRARLIRRVLGRDDPPTPPPPDEPRPK